MENCILIEVDKMVKAGLAFNDTATSKPLYNSHHANLPKRPIVEAKKARQNPILDMTSWNTNAAK